MHILSDLRTFSCQVSISGMWSKTTPCLSYLDRSACSRIGCTGSCLILLLVLGSLVSSGCHGPGTSYDIPSDPSMALHCLAFPCT